MHSIIQRKVTISMLFLALTLLGYVSYQRLDMEIFPNAELPMLYVQISSQTEVTPEYMEKEGVVPIEGAVGGLEDIERIESYAGVNRGMVNVYYEQGADLKYSYLKLQQKVNELQADMPDGFTVTVVKADDQNTTNVLMSLQVRGSGGVERLRNFCDENLSSDLENIDGVAGVTVYGGQEKSVDIMLDRAACEAYGLTPARVKQILSSNLQDKAYGGAIKDRSKRYFVYVSAEYVSVKDLENIPLGVGEATLKNVADVFYGTKEEESISRVNGKEAVTMIVMNESQVNIIDLSHKVRDVIDRLNEENQVYDVQVVIQNDQAETMEENIDQIINLAITGGILAVFILWIFLGNLAQISVVALAIPVSVFTAFNFFYAYDISINSLTLVGIALAIGMLIDNGVVVLENIYRLKSAGKSNNDAVVQGTKEVWRSVFAATLTTITIFLPFIFSSNYLIKMLGKHIGVSIISTLVVSLVVALLLIPMATHAFFNRTGKTNFKSINSVSLNNRGVRIYLLLLKTGLRYPAVLVVSGVILFFVTVFGVLAINVDSKTEVESSQINMAVELPTGFTLERTDEIVQQIEEKIKDVAEIEDVITEVQEEEASLKIMLKDDFQKINSRTIAEIRKDIDNRTSETPFADITLSTSSTSSSGGGMMSGGRNSGSAGFQSLLGIGEDEEYLEVRGQDFELMSMVADDIEYYLEEELEDIVSRVNVSVSDNQPEYHVAFDSRLMADYNVSRSSVSTELASFQNEVSSGVNYKEGNQEYEIVIKYSDDTISTSNSGKTLDELRALKVANDDKTADFNLEWFADIYRENGLRQIDRVNQGKQIEISYQYESSIYDSKALLEDARTQIQDVINAYNLPSGVAVELVQEESELNDFYALLYIAALLIFMILAAVFESFVTPFVLLFSIPLAAIGSFLALMMTGNSLQNGNTMMGFLILLGVVVNNGIILIDFTNVLRKRGFRKPRALMIAGLSRLRPILITATTTCVAMIPLAMGKAEYVSAIGAPFAITVIGGLSLSTLLTLVFIPSFYSGLENALAWIRQLPLNVHVVMWPIMAFFLGWAIIGVEDTLWKIADVLLVIVCIPAITYFVLESLRKASERIIPADEDIQIKIRNLVKIYDRPGRFKREWIAGRNLAEQAAEDDEENRNKWRPLVWQLPLYGYLHYFIWVYLLPGFWLVPFSLLMYAFQLVILKGILPLKGYKQNFWYKLLYYASPALFCAGLYLRMHNIGLLITLIILWYLGIAIDQTRELMKREGSKPTDYKGIQKAFVFMVSYLPVVGNVRKPFKALQGVSLDITTGMFGLLGPNGAGKSTMMRTIVGIYEQSYGKIWINGVDTTEKREELQSLIGFLPQEFGMYENMTAWQYLDYQAMLKGLKDPELRKERLTYVLNSVHMFDNRNKRIGGFSGGMKQRIGIAQILLVLPRILIVDEPTAGLDPRERIRFRNLLVELSQERVVIFSTHIIEDISSSCNNMAVVNAGKVIYKGSPNDMTKHAEGHVWRFYVKADEFDAVTKDMLVVHHMRDGDRIRVRVISEDAPVEGAENEMPLLEDAYLYMIRKKKGVDERFKGHDE